MLVKSKSGRTFKMPSEEENQAIHKGITDDPDSLPLTDEEWENVKPTLKRGRPLSDKTKKPISIRLSEEVLEYFRGTGKGWQTRLDDVLKGYVRSHQ